MVSVRMPDDRLTAIDELVSSGSHASRAALNVDAIDRLIAELVSAAIDRAIVEGYTRIPETAEELEWAEWSTEESIREEPW